MPQSGTPKAPHPAREDP